MGYSTYFEYDFRHRLDRLNKKIRKEKETASDKAKSLKSREKKDARVVKKAAAGKTKKTKSPASTRLPRAKKPSATKTKRVKPKKEGKQNA
jgi:hypothetical protein